MKKTEMFSEMVAGVNGSSDIEGISGMWHAGVWEGKKMTQSYYKFSKRLKMYDSDEFNKSKQYKCWSCFLKCY